MEVVILIGLLIVLIFCWSKILQLNKNLSILEKQNKELEIKSNKEKEELINSFKNATLEELNDFIKQKNEIAHSALENQEQLLNELLESKRQETEEILTRYDEYKQEKALEIHKHYEQWLQESEEQIAKLKSIADSAIEVAKASFKDEEQLRLHMLPFAADELEAIAQLNEVAANFPRIKSEILNVMFNAFYSGKIRELGRRLTDGQKLCGIYKITNVKTQQCYIGQSVDIAARWVTHVKRAVGVENETQNKLYPAMRREGIEYFSFQIVEIVPKERLREQELYWQEFYDARNWGYSVK